MKTKLIIIIGLASLSVLTACSNNESAKEELTTEQTESEQVKPNNGVVSYHGKYLELAENINDLEKDAPIIVKVTKKSEKATVTKETKE
ncbi:phage-related protein, putative, partial [Listeria monocytogenes FSL F2-208]